MRQPIVAAMASHATLRPGCPADQQQLLAIVWATVMVGNESDRDQLLARPELVQVPVEQLTAETCVVAELDSVPVGFAIVLPRPGGEAELDGLFVHPDWQRLGLGRALVAATADLARAKGSNALHVIANEDALSFYTAVGFIQTGMAPTDLRPAPSMELRLI
jgi:GNAT superfamily N-acetyltransferase